MKANLKWTKRLWNYDGETLLTFYAWMTIFLKKIERIPTRKFGREITQII